MQLETAQSLSQGSYAGMPLWDEVKKVLYQYWLDCNTTLFEINRDRAAGLKNGRETLFASQVLQIYMGCRSKLRYQGEQETVQKLQAMHLDEYFLDDAKVKAFKFRESMQAFLYLTDFLEFDRVTMFEKKQVDQSHVLVTRLEEGE